MTATEIYFRSPVVSESIVLWRTIGISAKPQRVSASFDLSDSEIPRLNSILVRREVRRNDARQRMKWIPSGSATRFSDGTFAVVYFSRELITSLKERVHWAFSGLIGANFTYDCTIRLEILESKFFGKIRNLCGQCPPYIMMVHPSDYELCHEIGRLATSDTDVHGIAVRSARALAGTNVPVFREDSIGEVLNVDAATVFIKWNPLCTTASVKGEEISVLGESVFELLGGPDVPQL